MAFNKILLLFAVLATLSVSFVKAEVKEAAPQSVTETIDKKSAVLVKSLIYVPTKCYRKYQTCCYRYYICRRRCIRVPCRYVRVCSKYIGSRCYRYKLVRVCRYPCYYTYCPRAYCTRPIIIKSKSYVAPLTYKRTLYSTKA